jgi:hypothetical protein
MHGQSTDLYTMSCDLWRQALSGDPDGALRVLEHRRGDPLPVLAADLLARLYVRAGRLPEAQTVWEEILQADPGYAPAVIAMNKLNSPWLIRAVAVQYSLWFGAGGLLLFALYGVGTLFLGHKDPSFAVMGAATILAVLGLYLAGLFGWTCLTAVSLFGLDRGFHRSRMRSGTPRPSRSGRSPADTLRGVASQDMTERTR